MMSVAIATDVQPSLVSNAGPATDIELTSISSDSRTRSLRLSAQNNNTSEAAGDIVPTAASSSPSDRKPEKLKLLSCCLCFLVAGLNDGSLGALVPYFLRQYSIGENFVGIVYATSFAGWAVAAVMMPLAKVYIGLRGTLLLGAGLYVFSQVLRIWVCIVPSNLFHFHFRNPIGQ